MRECVDCHKDISSSHGNSKRCDECRQRKVEEDKKRWSESAPDDWHRQNPENAAKHREWSRNYRINNKEHINAYWRRRRKNGE